MDLLIFGVISSAKLALIAVGFSFVFGISRISNFAHGAFYVLAGFIAWLLTSAIGLPYPLVVICTIALTGVIGALTFWLVIYRLRGQALSEVIATFSAGIAILEFFRWRGATGFFYGLPTFASGSIEVGGVVLDYQRIAIFVVGVLLVVFLYFFTHHTKTGLACRGMAQDDETSLCFGIDSDLVASISMGIGAAMAAVAAITIIPLGFISIDEGYQVLIFALAVGVVGGLESTLGIIVASFLLGFAQTVVSLYVSASLMMIVALIAILAVLLVRPSGLFGKFKELEERV